ncbi:MAG TPA: hypothetical protein VFI31_21205, partial [Pirellulales bacterium]|nr:hypothetical protein [Pirellulales bacterium]
PCPLLGPVRRKQKKSPVLLIAGIAACGLAVVMSFAAVIVWGIYSSASSLVASARSPSAASPKSQPVVLSGAYYPSPAGPNSGTAMPVLSNAGGPPGSSSAEQVIQNLLAKMNQLNGLLSQVVDGPSADRVRDQVVATFQEYMALAEQLIVVTRHISREEDRRLESLYMSQLNSGLAQLNNHGERLRALGHQLRMEEFHRQMDSLHARHRDRARAAQGPSNQPPQTSYQPPTYQPPTFQPPTFQPPSIPRRTPGMRPPTMPPRRFGR